MLARSTPHAVIQPKPGIGDVIWHLPFIRAIAAVSPGGQVTFLAPPTSGARELLAAEPAVAETIYFNHFGFGTAARRQSDPAGGAAAPAPFSANYRFSTAPFARRSPRSSPASRSASASASPRSAASSPTAAFRRAISTTFPSSGWSSSWPTWACRCTTTEPGLRDTERTACRNRRKVSSLPRPWIVLGIAASHPDKDWPAAYWAELLGRLRGLTHRHGLFDWRRRKYRACRQT